MRAPREAVSPGLELDRSPGAAAAATRRTARRARLLLRGSPGARRRRDRRPHGDGWKVRVAAPAERGRANEALLALLARALGLPPGQRQARRRGDVAR